MPDPPPTAEVALLEDVTVRAGGRRILGPITFRLLAGEHWALLGPNGSGKTTLVSLVSAERHPHSGTVTVLGERLGRSDVRRLRERIGSVGHLVADRLAPHLTALEVVLTGRDNVLAPWWTTFTDQERAAAAAALERLGCGGLAAQEFGRCSQGERQRVLLARSLYARHPLLVLDEPAVGVDLPGREALVAALDSLAASEPAQASVHVAHTLEELPTSVTHALLVRDGLTVASGPVAEVLTEEALGECYRAAFTLSRRDGRYSAWAKPGW